MSPRASYESRPCETHSIAGSRLYDSRGAACEIPRSCSTPCSPTGSAISSCLSPGGSCCYQCCSCCAHSPRYPASAGSVSGFSAAAYDTTHADLAATAIEALKVTARAARIVELSQPPTKHALRKEAGVKLGKGAFSFSVTNMDGDLVQCQASTTEKVRDLKLRLQDREGVDAETMRLVYAGKQLEDHHSLGHYGVSKASTVHMCRKLRVF